MKNVEAKATVTNRLQENRRIAAALHDEHHCVEVKFGSDHPRLHDIFREDTELFISFRDDLNKLRRMGALAA